jgi:predicted Fe-Mo cluster-binding NifX family protein
METIALTNWNGIISPMYDVSCCLMIVHPDGERTSINIRNMSLFDKAECCSGNGAAVVICGAISTIGYAALQDKGIRVISWIRGTVDDVIRAFQEDSTLPEKFMMPGCGYGRCRSGRRHRHFGGRHGML